METKKNIGCNSFLCSNKDIVFKYKEYSLLVITPIISFLLFTFAYLSKDCYVVAMSVTTYLTWHNIFEFTGVLVSFSVFIVAYYTYDQTRNLRMLVMGTVFLVVGLLDSFHTLSFKGMPAFFVENTSANRATTFWIISRMLAGVGFVVTRLINIKKESNIDKRIFLTAASLISLSILVVVTYYPQVLPRMYIDGHGLTQIKKYMEYTVILLYFISIVLALKEYNKTKNQLTIWFSTAIILSIFSEMAFVTYYSVYDVFNYLGHIYKFIAYFIIFRVVFVHNVQIPYIELSQAKKELKAHAEDLDNQVDLRTSELLRINRKLREDLEYARDIQKALLPARLPEEQGVCFNAKYFPAERVSGDFYNIFRLDDRNIGLYIGDVSGHGVSAAMLTVFINQTIKAIREKEDGSYKIMEPSEVLKRLYKSYNKTNFKEDVYVVLIYGIFNIDTKELIISSAGMNTPPLIINDRGEVKEIEIRGFPICKFIDTFTVEYTDIKVKLKSGDKVLFYTDGLTEAQDNDGLHYSEERLRDVLAVKCSLSNDKLSEYIVRDVFEFIGECEIKDDITLFIMDVH